MSATPQRNWLSKSRDALVGLGFLALVATIIIGIAIIVIGLAVAIVFAIAWLINAVFGVAVNSFLVGAVAVVTAL